MFLLANYLLYTRRMPSKRAGMKMITAFKIEFSIKGSLKAVYDSIALKTSEKWTYLPRPGRIFHFYFKYIFFYLY